MAKTISKIAYLDGIRGIAALLVVFHHFLFTFYLAYFSFDQNLSMLNGWDIKYGQSVFSVFTNGNFCVYIFFVLSGFVLSRKAFITNQYEVIRSGAQRRFLRLYIPIAFTMILACVLMMTHLFYNIPVSVISHSENWLGKMYDFGDPLHRLWTCLTSSTMFLGDNAFDTTLWTMSTELIGSFFVFAFLAFTHNSKKRLLYLFIIFYYCTSTQQITLLAFVFGISLNYIERYIAAINKNLLTVVALLLLGLGLLFGSYPTNDHTKDTVFEHLGQPLFDYPVWHVVGAWFLVTAFVISTHFQWLISLRVFRFLGHISFSLYLLHPLVICSFSCYLFLQLNDSVGYNMAALYVFLATLPLCILLSWLMAKYIDDPGVRFSRYVYARWFKKSSETDILTEVSAD